MGTQWVVLTFMNLHALFYVSSAFLVNVNLGTPPGCKHDEHDYGNTITPMHFWLSSSSRLAVSIIHRIVDPAEEGNDETRMASCYRHLDTSYAATSVRLSSGSRDRPQGGLNFIREVTSPLKQAGP